MTETNFVKNAPSINIIKKYQTLKSCQYIKTNTCLFFFQSNKSKAINWRQNEQILKKLQLIYYKLTNKIILKIFRNSIYKNFSFLVSGIILVLRSKITRIKNYKKILKTLNNSFSLLCMKLNNKIYSVNDIKKIYNFSYKKMVFYFYQLMEKNLKTSLNIYTLKSK